ncbi:MAG: DUF1254 domain-containing protein [Bacteroidota bacterium]
MKKASSWIVGLLFVLVFGVIGYYLTLDAIPKLIYRVAQRRIDIPVNTIAKPGPIDETARSVVMPNPDFLYATGFFDLDNGPLKLRGSLPADDYWSLALYQPNTVNFFVRNDQQFNSNEVDLVLATTKQAKQLETSSEVVECPTSKGFLLFRLLVANQDSLNVERVAKHQSSIALEAFEVFLD